MAREHETERPRFYRSFVYDRDAGGNALLLAEGYESVRRGAEMVRPNMDAVPDAPLPPGLELRPSSADQARALWDADIEIFRDHWGEVDDTPEAFAAFLGGPHFDPSL